VNEFVPNEDVHRYFQVSDALLLFYTYSTPSGVESVAYNFNLPIMATRVGNFPDTIKEGITGYIAEADDIYSMAGVMEKAIDKPINRKNISDYASGITWERYAGAIVNALF
jgi:glycosyltransferase involved in cell wall biosynthesis